MARYCTMADVRGELDKDPATAAYTVDDVAINNAIDRASAAIDTRCQQTFASEAITNELRRGESVILTGDNILEVTVSKSNVQSLTLAEVTTDLQTWHTLNITRSDVDPQRAGTVLRFFGVTAPLGRDTRKIARLSYTGGWVTLPPDIVQAAARLAAYLFMKRRAPFEATAMPNNQVIIPSDFPKDVALILMPWVRKRP